MGLLITITLHTFVSAVVSFVTAVRSKDGQACITKSQDKSLILLSLGAVKGASFQRG